MSDPIRWLHLSDFHVGKDDWAQRRLFEKIIEHVADQKGKGFIPDLVFITGDIANAGQKSEYTEFRRGFLAPLLDALGGKDWPGTLYAVPGNHDVDRGKNPDLDRASASSPGSHFFDPTREGKLKRDIVSPRFKQYRQSSVGSVPGNWIHEPSGAFAETSEIHGLRVGVVGINTAWLSMDDKESGKLTPGIALVEAALNKIKPCASPDRAGPPSLALVDRGRSAAPEGVVRPPQGDLPARPHASGGGPSGRRGGRSRFWCFSPGRPFRRGMTNPGRTASCGEKSIGSEASCA